ncbi:MAG: S1/P1 nuclease, partial [Dysgonamonadaceae bacterium]|nr:S1/P1 nuclease [Dysgonamonadaceae bacterium]
KQDNGQNIYQVILLTAYLKQVPNDTAMLKMLIHLVEDMHCPMHLGHADDKGGNSVQITWFRNKSNLHSLWDSGLIDSQKLSYTEYATHLMRINPLQNIPFDGNSNLILDWAWDVYTNTQMIYASVEETKKPYEYVYHYKPLLEKSLVTAAEHLAALLNYIYQ